MPDNEYEVQRSLGRIEGSLIEIKNEMKAIRENAAGLRTEFQTLEAGRLTRLESAFATFQGESLVKAKYSAVWVAALVGVAVAVGSQIVTHYLLPALQAIPK